LEADIEIGRTLEADIEIGRTLEADIEIDTLDLNFIFF